jgi:hypothetical protein
MKFICKLFGHKMYNIVWETNSGEFTVLCTRCEKHWNATKRLGIHHE